MANEYLLNQDASYRQNLLGRMQSDCKYYLGNGNCFSGDLWAGNVPEHLETMKMLYNSFSEEEKPNWISMGEILSYEEAMIPNRESLVKRLAEISEEMERMNYNQYAYGIMVDRMASARLWREQLAIQKYLENTPRTLTVQQEEFFKDSKCRDDEGNLLPLYHGTGTTITSFDTSFLGQGTEQYGSGFYFTTDRETAECYTAIRQKGDDGKELEKLGGEDNPNVVEVYVNLKNPIVVDGKEHASLRNVDLHLSPEQIEAILMRSPAFYTKEDNLLGDYLDYYWDICDSLQKKSDFYPLIADVAKKYCQYTDLIRLSSFFKGYEAEFLSALNFYTGHDGLIVNFGDSSHVIAWFPQQIKAVDNERPLDSKYIHDDLKSRVNKMTYENLLEQCRNFKMDCIPFEMDKQGFVTLFHRTTVENAQNILRTGIYYGRENGLFLSNKREGAYSAGFGEEVLAFRVPAWKLELDDVFSGGEAHFRLPIETKGYSLNVSDMLLENKHVTIPDISNLILNMEAINRNNMDFYFFSLTPVEELISLGGTYLKEDYPYCLQENVDAFLPNKNPDVSSSVQFLVVANSEERAKDIMANHILDLEVENLLLEEIDAGEYDAPPIHAIIKKEAVLSMADESALKDTFFIQKNLDKLISKSYQNPADVKKSRTEKENADKNRPSHSQPSR